MEILKQKRHMKALEVCLWPPYTHTYTQVYTHVFKKGEKIHVHIKLLRSQHNIHGEN